MIGYLTTNVTIKNCSFVGGAENTFNAIVGINQNTSFTVFTNSCYVQVNEMKYYTDGDFLGWGIVESMNGGMPMQRELFFMAEFAPALDVASYFAGWTKI